MTQAPKATEPTLNPYAPPVAAVHDVAVTPYDAIREAHIKHEASIKSIGVLYMLSALGIFGAGIALLPAGSSSTALGIGLLALGIGQFVMAFALRKFKRWARIVGTIFSTIGLLAIGLGTLISAYILYLFWGKKGKTIFSPDYQDVIAATPHIKYKTSIWIWVFLIGLVVLAVFGAAYSGRALR